jgi:hypothetical protein
MRRRLYRRFTAALLLRHCCVTDALLEGHRQCWGGLRAVKAGANHAHARASEARARRFCFTTAALLLRYCCVTAALLLLLEARARRVARQVRRSCVTAALLLLYCCVTAASLLRH